MHDEKIWGRLAGDVLSSLALPDIEYPLVQGYEELFARGKLSFISTMLYGLQQWSGVGGVPWLTKEVAMDRLASLIAPKVQSTLLRAAGSNWWLEFGPVDLTETVVTIQRQDMLIAAMVPTDGGRLRAATYRPLDSKSKRYLKGLAMLPNAAYGVSGCESNWEYALDCSVKMGNAYAAERGESYLSFWEFGIGITGEREELPEWRMYLTSVSRSPMTVWAEMMVHADQVDE